MEFYQISVLSTIEVIMVVFLAKAVCPDVKLKFLPLLLIEGILGPPLYEILVSSDVISHIISTTVLGMLFVLMMKDSKIKRVDKLVIFFVAMMFAFFIQLVCIIILTIIFPKFTYSFNYGLLAQCLGLIITVLVAKLSPLSELYIYIEGNNKFFKTMVVNIFMVYYILSISWFDNAEAYVNSVVGLSIIILLMILINNAIFRESLINRQYKEKNQIYETYIPIVENMVDEIKRQQHDYHNHIQTMQTMLDVLPEEAKKYMVKFEEQSVLHDLMKLDNKIIMAFLYAKYNKAKEKGVHLTIELKEYFLHADITDYELVEIYGILIDNAIEATTNTKVEGIVKIVLEKEKNQFVFRISNPSEKITNQQIQKFFEKGYSTKKESMNHGIGLYKVRKILKEKSGTIEMFYNTTSQSIVVEVCHS